MQTGEIAQQGLFFLACSKKREPIKNRIRQIYPGEKMKKIFYLLPMFFTLLACGAQPSPTQDISNIVNATLTAVAQNSPQMETPQTAPTQDISSAVNATLTAVAQNNPQGSEQQPVVAQVTGSLRIEQEQGSGAICTAGTTYFVYAEFSSNGPATAQYQIYITDASGQVPNGTFEGYNAPQAEGTLTFDSAKTETLTWRITGPYQYPEALTIRGNLNGQSLQSVPVACQ